MKIKDNLALQIFVQTKQNVVYACDSCQEHLNKGMNNSTGSEELGEEANMKRKKMKHLKQ